MKILSIIIIGLLVSNCSNSYVKNKKKITSPDDLQKLVNIYCDKNKSTAERNFCKECGSALWLWDPTWSELIHPFASAIDTDLPKAPEQTHLMVAFKASWVQCFMTREDKSYEYYPEESIEDWHKRLKLEC